jgi:hypothetical protein
VLQENFKHLTGTNLCRIEKKFENFSRIHRDTNLSTSLVASGSQCGDLNWRKTVTEAINISQAMGWRDTLTARHAELVNLRNVNSHQETRTYGQSDKERIINPLYDVVALDKTVGKIAMELRKLDEAIKATNQSTTVKDYVRDESVLGELIPAAPAK